MDPTIKIAATAAALACAAGFFVGCAHDADPAAVTLPAASATAAPTPFPPPSATAPSSPTTDAAAPVAVTLGTEMHFKSGARAIVTAPGAGGPLTFTVQMLPKLMVSGPTPEIEQAQIDVARGAQHGSLHVDTVHKQAEWGGLVFELGYADVYHDDIELTVRPKASK